MAPLIQLNQIIFGYDGRAPVFDGIDFSIRPGESVGLVGPNGSGKTTLFRLIVGLESFTSGALSVLDRKIQRPEDLNFVREKIGFVFQNSDDQLFCPTVEEDVAFGLLNQGKTVEQTRREVAETLLRLGLNGYEARITYDLSGGEKRLVALATVLAMRPEALLLDEPEAGLDPAARRHLVSILADVGGTQVISSHDMEFIRATCHRVCLLYRGEILADGPTDEVLSNADLMLDHGLEVPYSIAAEGGIGANHHHGRGPAHGHGHSPAAPHSHESDSVEQDR